MATNVGGGMTSSDDYDDYDDHFVDPFEMISSSAFLILGVTTIWIYYRIAKFHSTNGFKTNFQRIFFILITNDMVSFLAQLFDVRLPTWGVHEWYFYIKEGPVPTILNYLSTVTLMIQSFGTLLVAINRATSLMFPVHYERDIENWMYFGVNMSCLFLSFPLNFYLGYRLLIKRKEVKLTRREFAFHATTVFQFIMGCVNAIDTIICNTQSMDDYWIFFETAPIFCDLCNFAPLWFIFIVSKEIRSNVFGKREDSIVLGKVSNFTTSPRRSTRSISTISVISAIQAH
ncbi:unnamed protein product, partial [Mesorhabditis belari]|uniref:Serpentine receptor class gamma n=1 Tax=Mesorhabditis belari TaxID=2138241 RepID=A0AAF3EDT9_9BILA